MEMINNTTLKNSTFKKSGAKISSFCSTFSKSGIKLIMI
jgi:hypothetical protein